MRILKIVLGGVLVYVLVVVGIHSLTTSNASMELADSNSQSQLIAMAEDTASDASGTPQMDSDQSAPSPELAELSIQLASQSAAVGRANRAVSRRATSSVTVATTTQPTPAGCTFGGVTLQSGQSAVFYSAQSVTAPASCTSVSQSRVCTNGTLSGTSTFQYATCAVVPLPAPATTTSIVPPTPSAPSTIKKLWGAFLGGDYTAAALPAFEAQIGAPANLQAVFIGWGNGAGDFPAELATPLKSSGKTLVIFWEPTVNLDAINSGIWDTYMRSFAASVKAYGGPIILAPFHEMNGNWDIWDGTVGTNSPAKLVAAWVRMHNVFVTAGVTNVKWGWAVNNESVPNIPANWIEKYYPGDAYVDIVGVDGFNFNGVDGWLTFDQVFNSSLTKISIYNKPIYVFSFASAAGPQKAAWITDALTVQMNKYPQIQGWIWFNENKEQNWLIWSDSASLSAFQAAVK